MQRSIQKFCCCLLAMAVLLSVWTVGITASAATKLAAKDGVFAAEAESLAVNAGFTILDDSAAFGGKCLTTKAAMSDAPAKDTKGEIEFSFVPAKVETNYLWVRVNPTSVNKTVWISINGADYKQTPLKGVKDVWSWVKILDINAPKAGEEITIRLISKNGFFNLDKLVITADAAYTPDGTKAAATPTPAATSTASSPNHTYTGNDTPFNTVDGTVMIEAENIKRSENYTLITDSALSGGKGLNTSSGENKAPLVTDPADLEFSFQADKTGQYFIWARVNPTTPNKSITVSINKGEYQKLDLKGEANVYYWKQIAEVKSVQAGNVVNVRIINRNNRFDFDNFVVTNVGNAELEGVAGIIKKMENTLPDNVYPKPTFTPPPEHPRVYFTKKDIPKILENATKPQNAKAWAKHESNLDDSAKDKISPLAPNATSNCSSGVLGVVESRAFDYAIRGNKEAGLKAISAMRDYTNQVVFPKGDYNNSGQTVFTISIVYDWCYDLLTDEDKQSLIEAIAAIAAQMEIGWPPVNQRAVAGHGGEGQLMRDLLCAGIAVYDERPDIYNFVAGRFFAEFVAPRKFMYPAHTHNQGTHYTQYRGQWEILAALIFDRIGLPEVFGADQKYFLFWPIYARRPDGQVLRDGDTNINNALDGAYNRDYYRPMLIGASYFNNPYYKWEGMRELPYLNAVNPSLNQSMNCVEFLIFNNPDLEGRPASELPLTMYYPSPKGGAIARTGWADGYDSPTVVAEMEINEINFGNHQHLDAGAFQIYYKGALATDTGYYNSAYRKYGSMENDGNTTYGSSHYKNYMKRSIAHNTMSVYDPNEPSANFANLANDGGQRVPNNNSEASTLDILLDPANGYHTGKILGHEFGQDPMAPNYTYLKGDLAMAYSDKIAGYERSFMFLNLKDKDHPAAMLVFDRVESSQAEFKKSWLLHGLYQPTINGNQTVFRNDQKGYNGKLTVDTLLPKPENTAIEAIGGPDKEFWVDGTNYSATTYPNGNNEGGGWRIEVSPKTPSKQDYFLNVLQVGDANPDMPALPVTVIENDQVAGAQIADRIVIFGKAKDRTKSNVSFAFAGDKEFEITVAGLEKGTWQVTKDGEPLTQVSATEEGGVIVYKGTAGSYTLSYLNDMVNRPVFEAVKPQHEGIGIRVANRLIYTDVEPTIRNDRTLVPMRAIFEKLGVSVSYDESTSTATAVKDGREIKITEDSQTATIDGQAIQLDVPAAVIDGRFMVPVRFVSEAFFAKVEWDEFAKIVNVTPGIDSSTVEPGTIPIESCEWSSQYEENVGEYSYDKSTDTMWSVAGYDGEWILYDLGKPVEVKSTQIIWNKGDQRQSIFNIEVSDDKEHWTKVFDGKSDGKSSFKFEEFLFPASTKARYVRINGHGNSVSEWNSIIEIKFLHP